jgi:phage gp36-like protein
MAYATAQQMRDRYRQGIGGIDEFALNEDSDLEQAIAEASSEVDRWRPAGDLTLESIAIVRDVVLSIARMLAHRDHALGDEHPIVRDAAESRAWLRALADGKVVLSIEDDGSPTGAIAAIPRTMIYGADWASKYDLT